LKKNFFISLQNLAVSVTKHHKTILNNGQVVWATKQKVFAVILLNDENRVDSSILSNFLKKTLLIFF
jgi:hypothetical protein